MQTRGCKCWHAKRLPATSFFVTNTVISVVNTRAVLIIWVHGTIKDKTIKRIDFNENVFKKLTQTQKKDIYLNQN